MPARSAPTNTSKNPTAVGLFAGIGGFEVGFERAGISTSLLCEIDIAALAVLQTRFPKTQIHLDVMSLDSLPRGVDIVAAGFPCQDLSQAGKTAGISGSRSGLIGEVFRLLRRRPIPLVVLENVPFMLQLAKGRALEVIVSELEDLGYSWAYRVLDTRAFGLPQRRQRVFLVASLKTDPRDVLLSDDAGDPVPLPDEKESPACGFFWTEGIRGLGWAVDAIPTLKGGSSLGIPSPPAILLPAGDVVTPDLRDAERLQGFPADWTKPAERVCRKGQRWKLVGNAVTVDVAEWLGKCLLSPGSYNPGWDLPLGKGSRWPTAAWNVGGGRFRSTVSAWPVHRKTVPLGKFLRFPAARLSARATAGFLGRAKSSSLRFPAGFIEKLESHLQLMRREAIPA